MGQCWPTGRMFDTLALELSFCGGGRIEASSLDFLTQMLCKETATFPDYFLPSLLLLLFFLYIIMQSASKEVRTKAKMLPTLTDAKETQNVEHLNFRNISQVTNSWIKYCF